MIKKLTVIITLYKTPEKYLKNLNQYKNFKLIIFDQATQNNSKLIAKYIKSNFQYFYSNKNIGLPNATNFLISKIRTDFFLFTQADIEIDELSIKNLFNSISKKNNVIFAGPKFLKSRMVHKNYNNKIPKFVKKLDASLMICSTKKVRKIGFFDKDYFLYWEDKDLMQRVNQSNFKMIQQNNAYAIHNSSKSSSNNIYTMLIRRINFKYGEYLFEYKHKNIKIIKIFRNIFNNILILPFNLILFRKNKVIENFSQPIGTLKFLLYLLLK